MSTKPTRNTSTKEDSYSFFAIRTRAIVPKQFYSDAKRIHDNVKNMSRKELLEKYQSLQTKATKIEYIDYNKYLVRTEVYEAIRRGYIAPSMFNKYRRCARELALDIIETKKEGGIIITAEQLRSFLRGILIHILYYEKYAVGKTEVYVESEKHSILGYIDEVRDNYVLVELKSSYNPDLVGAGLQIMSYMLAFADINNVPLDTLDGYIVTMRGTYRVVFDNNTYTEYIKRLRTIVDIAINEEIDKLPPRLPQRLMHRCASCPHRGLCLKLPDNYKTYSKYFEAMNFTKLVKKSPKTTLDTFLNTQQ